MMRSGSGRLIVTVLVAAVALSGCVYFNTLYNAERDYTRGEKALRQGRARDADVAFDSVIAKTARVLIAHPSSKYADDAAILKARSEVYRRRWESAYGSAETAARAASAPAVRSVAEGLMGVAAFRLGDAAGAERHLDRALEGELSGRDRTTFLFVRGRARLARSAPDAAAEDLRAAVEQAEGTGLDQLELASALAGVGEYELAATLLRRRLELPSVVDLNDAERSLVDTLLVHAPEALAATLDELLDASLRPVKASVLHLHRGRTRERLGETAAAIEDYRAAHGLTSLTRSAGEAGYRRARLELRDARESQTVMATLSGLQTAASVAPAALRDSAQSLLASVQRFRDLIGVYESRGSSAAEALLRAAEVARDALGTSALARGLYLRYLEVAPQSPWTAKAALGALALSGHSGDGILGVRDLGAETDAALRARLDALGPADPYRLAQARASSAVAESAYARSERELQQRLVDIRSLVEPAAAPAVDEDSAAAPVDTTRRARRDTTRAEI